MLRMPQYLLRSPKLGLIYFTIYSASRLIGSRIIESATYCYHILLVPLYLNSAQNMSVNWIIWLLRSLLCWPKVILLSGRHWWPSPRCIAGNLLVSLHGLERLQPQHVLQRNVEKKTPFNTLTWKFISFEYFNLFWLSWNVVLKIWYWFWLLL